ncbi:hypothetical protein LSAT2_003017 [Lamellibrachia satsuma]|nr:hypothetical protein LSAT2_003017 [Lamellibrachia satsuma]
MLACHAGGPGSIPGQCNSETASRSSGSAKNWEFRLALFADTVMPLMTHLGRLTKPYKTSAIRRGSGHGDKPPIHDFPRKLMHGPRHSQSATPVQAVGQMPDSF